MRRRRKKWHLHSQFLYWLLWRFLAVKTNYLTEEVYLAVRCSKSGQRYSFSLQRSSIIIIINNTFANLQTKTFNKLLNELFNVNLTWIYLDENCLPLSIFTQQTILLCLVCFLIQIKWSGFYSGASARAKESLIAKRKWETYPDPIHARESGYDDSFRPTVRMDWQGGAKQILRGWGWGIQVMQLVFVLAKHQPVHIEAANGIFPVL